VNYATLIKPKLFPWETVVIGPKNLSRLSIPDTWFAPKRSQREAGNADSEKAGDRIGR
jgi:hypothetical protein